MKLTITPTATLTEVDGVPCRLWVGQTDTGVPVTVIVRGVVVLEVEARVRYHGELVAAVPRGEDRHLPLRAALQVEKGIPWSMLM